MSETQRRVQPTKQVCQFDLGGIFIKEWNSIEDIGRYYNINTAGIWRCCNNQGKSASKYLWKYKESFENGIIPNKIDPIKKEYVYNGEADKIAEYSIEGNFLKLYNNAKELLEQSKDILNTSSIHDACRRDSILHEKRYRRIKKDEEYLLNIGIKESGNEKWLKQKRELKQNIL